MIDRFYAINTQFHHGRRAVLLATAWNTQDWTIDALVSHFDFLLALKDEEDVKMFALNHHRKAVQLSITTILPAPGFQFRRQMPGSRTGTD